MSKNISKVALYGVNIILGLITILPILYALDISIMSGDQAFSYPLKLIPRELHFQNYLDVLNMAPIPRFILNTFVVSTLITAGQILISCAAAFAFSFFEFKGKKIIFILILATMMIPGESTIISNYLTFGEMGLLDTYRALVIPFLGSAMGIFMIRQYYLILPREIYEAAKIDGCNNFQFFLRIVLPMSKTVVGSFGVYTFLSSWNHYMWPLLVTSKDESRTVQIGISMLQSVDNQSFGPIMAGIIMILIPSILIFVFGQKQLIEGMTSGAVKG
ncbi:sn-glycerol-3-phosphate transport system permease protein UgpE [Clostridium pasteurianum DSM 525 = ATCC 6013]|uniref:ABC-type transporter, integral membrane subunit n=1 Tax=Clostridium pasteurianum DSM 525 = ATCC 6013 TaxID=1262449 RepID=A0A0H3J1R6_CLOPA|nr:carbohydrate ABC transporter permease [Clostridium pasteurianum]AJA46647.1 sn-glycerol-3-phosphate transport system permease protein UgpE [Clostridium pasteurianum DSM 525 = ATCC 6013]AJA50635.1 sn-glycerol-3-phosphate transport system permease protein UgpE [Clostridium pasteurianum DSM 525 = ATCC 6013]AOZ74057.1 ABC transporter permease [Clostridium pasteurianum DSM 525 = ATCC 6013]AOZ77854.1 ABC transporter permease [Clostridium pasteurianum]ELP61212.1 Sugar permease [Clostridium pasteuri